MNWQHIAVVAIGIIAAAYIIRRVVLTLRGKRRCDTCTDRQCPHRQSDNSLHAV